MEPKSPPPVVDTAETAADRPEAETAGAESVLEGLPTRVRAAADLEPLTASQLWADSALPVPPPADADSASQDLLDDDDEPTLGPATGAPAGPVGLLETVDDPRIPAGQSFFKIGEVARIVGVKPYVLRYWESEIAAVQPEKTDTRQRRYRRIDVATLLQVQRLRHEEKLSLARIRVLLQRGDTQISASGAPMELDEASRASVRRELDALRQQVMELLDVVEN